MPQNFFDDMEAGYDRAYSPPGEGALPGGEGQPQEPELSLEEAVDALNEGAPEGGSPVEGSPVEGINAQDLADAMGTDLQRAESIIKVLDQFPMMEGMDAQGIADLLAQDPDLKAMVLQEAMMADVGPEVKEEGGSEEGSGEEPKESEAPSPPKEPKADKPPKEEE